LNQNPSPVAGEERDLARNELSRSGEGASAGAENIGAQTRAAPSPQPSPARGEGVELPDELRVFDYIYGVLHSPDYRRTYAQFLKIDFPRIPNPASPEVFAHVAEKGGQLRRLHLMEDAAIGTTPYPFKGDGDNVVVKPVLSDDGPSTASGRTGLGWSARRPLPRSSVVRKIDITVMLNLFQHPCLTVPIILMLPVFLEQRGMGPETSSGRRR
jgi:hypothetical protein